MAAFDRRSDVMPQMSPIQRIAQGSHTVCHDSLTFKCSCVLQDVLCKAVGGSAMTIEEATNIADSALEHTVRTILASLQAPEILKSTAGKFTSSLHPFTRSPTHSLTYLLIDSSTCPLINVTFMLVRISFQQKYIQMQSAVSRLVYLGQNFSPPQKSPRAAFQSVQLMHAPSTATSWHSFGNIGIGITPSGSLCISTSPSSHVL